ERRSQGELWDEHDCDRRTRRTSPEGRPAVDLALDHDDQPQGYRHAVPDVLAADAVRRRRDGARDPDRAVPAWAAVRGAALLQPDDDGPRADHDLRRDHAGVRGLRELDGAADDRRAGYGAAEAE